jgi:hypothetical protein
MGESAGLSRGLAVGRLVMEAGNCGAYLVQMGIDLIR